MKLCLLIPTIFIILISCNDLETVKCEEVAEVEAIKSTILKELRTNTSLYDSMGMEDIDEYIDPFFTENMKVSLFRTIELNQELNRCKCAAQIDINSIETTLTDDVFGPYDAQVKFYLLMVALKKELMVNPTKNSINIKTSGEVNINFEYSIQRLNTGELVVEYGNDFDLLFNMLTIYYWDNKMKTNE